MIPNPYSGVSIVFEGIDGCGKTVQLERTTTWLSSFTQQGLSESLIVNTPRFHICRAKEPGKVRFFGKKIYADLADKKQTALHKINPRGFQAWYACDSKENLRQEIIPALKVGSVVLCDRFRPSMVYGAQVPGEIPELMAMNQQIIGEDFVWPDLILIFDLDANTAIERLKKKSRELDEHEKRSVLEIVRINYSFFAKTYPNCIVINAQRSEKEIFEYIKKILLPVIESKTKYTTPV